MNLGAVTSIQQRCLAQQLNYTWEEKFSLNIHFKHKWTCKVWNQGTCRDENRRLSYCVTVHSYTLYNFQLKCTLYIWWRQKTRWTKANVSCLIFSTLRNISLILRVAFFMQYKRVLTLSSLHHSAVVDKELLLYFIHRQPFWICLIPT